MSAQTTVRWRVYRRIRSDPIAALGALIIAGSIALAAFSVIDEFVLDGLLIEMLLTIRTRSTLTTGSPRLASLTRLGPTSRGGTPSRACSTALR